LLYINLCDNTAITQFLSFAEERTIYIDNEYNVLQFNNVYITTIQAIY